MWGALIGAGASLLAGKMGADAASDASDAQIAAQMANLDFQKEIYEDTLGYMLPYVGRGYQGLDHYAMNLGLMPPGSKYTPEGFSYVNPDGSVVGPNNPPQGYFPIHQSVSGDPQAPQMQAFYNAPGAQFMTNDQERYGHFGMQPNDRYGHFYSTPAYSQTYNAGLDQVDESAAMKGMNMDAGQATTLANYVAGNASQRWNDYMNQLAALSDIGQVGANSMAGWGNQMAGRVTDANTAIGDARASGYIGANNAYANAANQIGGIAGRYYG